MRTLLVMGTILLIAQYGQAQPGGRGQGGGRGPGGGRGQQAAQPQPPPDPGFECFDRVETPEFPASALQAHVDGTVWVRLQVTPQGTAGKIETKVTSAWGDAQKLLTPAVEKAIQASKLKAECAGKTVAVVYRYELHGEATGGPKPIVRTESNITFIESQPESAPAAKKSAAAK